MLTYAACFNVVKAATDTLWYIITAVALSLVEKEI